MTYSFTYTARSTTGRFVAGSLDASSRMEALELLRLRSLVLTSIVASETVSGTVLATLTGGISGITARAVSFRSLATLIHAGLPLRHALGIIAEQTRGGPLREALASVAVDIENGATFSEALARHPRVFSRTVCAMIRAGEISGTLDIVLDRISSLLERSNALRKRTLSAIAYPGIVTVMALGLIVFLVGTIVPAMRALFRGLNHPLPFLTRALIAVGDRLHDPWIWLTVGAGTLAGIAAFRIALHNEPFAQSADSVKQRIPVFGSLLRRLEVSMSTRTLGTLVQAGVALDSALEITSDVVSSYGMRRTIAKIAEHARLGQSLAPAFASSGFYEAHYVALVRAAEEAGMLGDMLLRIADYADVDIESTLAAISTLLEPLLIILIGGIVGLIVAAILVPLYSGIGNLA